MGNRLDEIDKSKWNEKWIKKNVVEVLWWVSDALLTTLSIFGQEIILMVEDYWGNYEMIKRTEDIAREELNDPDEGIKRRIKEYRDSDVVEWDSWYLSDRAKMRRKNLETKKTEFHETIKRTQSALKSLKDSLINKNEILNEN